MERDPEEIPIFCFIFHLPIKLMYFSWVLLFVVFGVVIHFILISITAFYLWNLPFELCHKLSILIAIYFSNICIYSISNQFLCAQMYLSSRFQNINDILSLLIFDEPIGNNILLTENAVAAVKQMATNMQRRSVVQNVFEKTGKSGITYIHTVDSNTFTINYPFEKEFPRKITSTSGANSEVVKQCRMAKFAPFSVIAYKT